MSEPLPGPGFDMDDRAAADWLLDLADHYPRADRLNVRALALRLASGDSKKAAAAKSKHDDAVHGARLYVKELEEELARLPADIDRARNTLADVEAGR